MQISFCYQYLKHMTNRCLCLVSFLSLRKRDPRCLLLRGTLPILENLTDIHTFFRPFMILNVAKISANFLTSLLLFILFARLCSFPKSVNNYVLVMEVQCDFYEVLTELINSTFIRDVMSWQPHIWLGKINITRINLTFRVSIAGRTGEFLFHDSV